MSRTTRTVIGSILLVIAGFTAVAGLGAFWTQHKILDEQTWVATSKAREPGQIQPQGRESVAG